MPSTRSDEANTETVALGSVLVEWKKVHIETNGQENCNAKIADGIRIVIPLYRSPLRHLPSERKRRRVLRIRRDYDPLVSSLILPRSHLARSFRRSVNSSAKISCVYLATMLTKRM